VGDGTLREGANGALLMEATVGLDADGTRAPCPLLDSRAAVAAAATVSTTAGPDAPTGDGALGVRLDSDDGADGVAPPGADARDTAPGRRTPNAAPAAADMPPDAAAVPTCAAFFTGAAAADTA
jgi:hypothetical protein